jgi:hypothetical protein
MHQNFKTEQHVNIREYRDKVRTKSSHRYDYLNNQKSVIGETESVNKTLQM